MSQTPGIHAYEKPVENDFEYVYSENKNKGFIKVTKAMMKVLLGVSTKLSELENDKEFIDKTVADLENYYSKTETYSKEEVNDKISLIPKFSVKVVYALPHEDISETTIYLVPANDGDENLYTEYINVNGLWEILGTQKIASLEIDATLTKEGYAADAKITGEKIGELQETVNDLLINARNYGIVEDGVTDVAPLFTQLVAELSANGGGTIYLPNGNYMVGSRITWRSNVSLVGESHKAVLMPYCDDSVEQGFAAISWLELKDDGKWKGLYSESNPMVNCHFSNFTIDGINQNPSKYDSYPKGINIHFMKDCTFEKIQFLNTFATGLGIDFLENVFIHNIYCENCGRGYAPTQDEAIAGGAGIGIGTMGMSKESCVISDCIAVGCGNYGIFLEGGSKFPEGGCESYYTISNCQTIDGRNYGIAVKGTSNVIVANNIMRNNNRDGFATLGRVDRHCENIQITGNISIDNDGCGFRFSDAVRRDAVTNGIYMIGNVSSGNNIGIEVGDYDFDEMYFDGNQLVNNEQDYVVDGRLFNAKKQNQLIKTIYSDDVEWENRIYMDDGTMNDNAASRTTVDYFYCGGSQNVGFYTHEAHDTSSGANRIAYVQWFDVDKNFISREGATVNGSGYKRYTPPTNAKYVKFRVGLNKGTLTNEIMRGVECIIYMTDRNEFVRIGSSGGYFTNADKQEIVTEVLNALPIWTGGAY